MTIPQSSALVDYASGAYFSDHFSIDIPYQQENAFDVYLCITQQTPRWIATLMDMRNKIVSKLGLKHLGRMQDVVVQQGQSYQPGDRLGIFTLVSCTDQEIVLEDSDKHLDVRVSFLVEPKGEMATVHATSVVHVHNAFGRLYMFFVTPFHKVIVPRSLKALTR